MHCNSACWKNLWNGGVPTLIVGVFALIGVVATLVVQWLQLRRMLEAQDKNLLTTFKQQDEKIRESLEREANAARRERLYAAMRDLKVAATTLSHVVANPGAPIYDMRREATAVLDTIAALSFQIEFISAPGPKLILDAAVVVQRSLGIHTVAGALSSEEQRRLLVEPAEVLITTEAWLRAGTIPPDWTWEIARAAAPAFDWVASIRSRLGLGVPGDAEMITPA